jgi:hypothetical protein
MIELPTTAATLSRDLDFVCALTWTRVKNNNPVTIPKVFFILCISLISSSIKPAKFSVFTIKNISP